MGQEIPQPRGRGRGGPPEAEFVARRDEIRRTYEEIVRKEAEFRAEVEAYQAVIPDYSMFYVRVARPLYLLAHRIIDKFGTGDWNFDDLSARDMAAWRRIHAYFLILSSYLQDMQSFGGNYETLARLASPGAAEELRRGNLEAYQRAELNVLHEFGVRQVRQEDLDNELKRIEISLEDYQKLVAQQGLNFSGRLPHHGFAYPRNAGGSGHAGSFAWAGSGGENYRARLREQELAAARMAQISNYILFAIQGTRSSFNDFLSGVQVFVSTILATIVTLLVWARLIRIQFLLLLRAATAIVVAGVIANPVAAAAAAAARAAAVEAWRKVKFFLIFAAITPVVTGLYGQFVVLDKNYQTLRPIRERFRVQLRNWMNDTAALPNGRWPNPVSDIQFPGMAQDRSGRWSVATTPIGRGLHSDAAVRGYRSDRSYRGPDGGWWPDPPPQPPLPPDPPIQPWPI